MKAKFEFKTYRGKFQKHTELWYSYRGHEYAVIPDADYPYTMREQHLKEQKFIDHLCDQEARMKNTNAEPAEIGFNMFWEYVEANNEEN